MLKNSSASRHSDDDVDYADSAFQVLAAQISANYLKSIKARIVPELGEFSKAPLRELRTLAIIAHFAAPITGSRISRMLSYDPATVSRSTRWLIENDLIVVEDNTEDARSVLYELTPKGLKLSALFRDLSAQSAAELNAEDPKPPSRKDIAKALSILKAVRDRSERAARLGEVHRRAKIRKGQT